MISTHAFHAIQALDLTPIKRKLMHQTVGEGWSQTKADAMEEEYRRFLYLQSRYPTEQTAPTLDVDTFWHYHILDTVKYAADCAQAFGYFLHHHPYLGMMDDDAPGVDIDAGERTRSLYEATFGVPYIRAQAYGEDARACGAARCNALCTSAVPLAKGTAHARCNALCTATVTPLRGAATARCNALCTAAAPKSGKHNARSHQVQS